jgi:hypothetical protein
VLEVVTHTSKLEVKSVSSVDGTADIIFIRGKKRHFCELTVKATFGGREDSKEETGEGVVAGTVEGELSFLLDTSDELDECDIQVKVLRGDVSANVKQALREAVKAKLAAFLTEFKEQ